MSVQWASSETPVRPQWDPSDPPPGSPGLYSACGSKMGAKFGDMILKFKQGVLFAKTLCHVAQHTEPLCSAVVFLRLILSWTPTVFAEWTRATSLDLHYQIPQLKKKHSNQYPDNIASYMFWHFISWGLGTLREVLFKDWWGFAEQTFCHLSQDPWLGLHVLAFLLRRKVQDWAIVKGFVFLCCFLGNCHMDDINSNILVQLPASSCHMNAS